MTVQRRFLWAPKVNVFAVFKPKGPSSYDIIRELKIVLKNREKIGHAGTLDPLASGVLVIGVGNGTKKLREIVGKEKEYIAVIKLGEESTTDDAEGEKRAGSSATPPSRENIERALGNFVGEILQAPPAYSAVKILGQPAYARARKGEKVAPKTRKVTVKSIDLLEYAWPILKIRVVTGPGVYIRSLARDLGRKLGTLGYLADLERTRVGDFRKNGALSIEEAKQMLADEGY